jgi:hypothetical protein
MFVYFVSVSIGDAQRTVSALPLEVGGGGGGVERS